MSEAKATAAGTAVEAAKSAQSVAEMIGSVDKIEHKAKKRYTNGLKNAQLLEVGVTDSLHALSKALTRGLKEWDERRTESAEKRRDGAIRDGFKNSGKALSRALEESAKAPALFVDAISDMKLFR